MTRTVGALKGIGLGLFLLFAADMVYGQPASGQSGGHPQQDVLGKIMGSTSAKSQVPGTMDVSGLSVSVGRAIVWDNYWFGYWGNKINRISSAGEILTGWPVPGENGKDIDVLVDEIHSELFCTRGNQPVCSTVSDYEDDLVSAGPDPQEYETRKQRSGAGRQKISIILTPTLLESIKFGSFDAPKIEKVERLFDEHILNKEFFDAIRQGHRPGLVHDPIRIRVGNFNLDSPFIYFYVEGDPYLQTVELDQFGNHFVHIDEWSIDSPPHTKDYPHAMKRIRENGASFVVKEGKLVKEPS